MTFKQCLYTFLDSRLDMSDTAKIVLMVSLMIASAVIAYLLGSLNFAIIFSKYFYRDDVRNHGSGNAGATNMLRTYGKGKAALTLVCDMLKCAIAVIIGGLLFDIEGADIAGLFCVIGHVFPCWFKFRGGKGVAVAAMVMLLTSWPVFLLLLLIFIIIVVGTKYVSLGSVMASLLYPVLLSSWNAVVGESKSHSVIMAFLITLIVVVMHRENIKRILDKTESKISLCKCKKKGEVGDEDGDVVEDNVPIEDDHQTANYKRYQNKKRSGK